MENKHLLTISSKNLFVNHYELRKRAEKHNLIISPTYFGEVTNPIGLEVEAEKAKSWQEVVEFVFWNKDHDNSLKDQGIEVISYPLLGRNIDYALEELFVRHKPDNFKWSRRTSIHVHVNVSTLYTHDLMAMLMLYAFFEPIFMSFVEETRKENPYCYPITTLNPDVLQNNGLFAPELKYCAFNTGPVTTYCTVEFRGLEGTQSLVKIRRWIKLCTKLHKFVETHRKKEVVKSILNAINNENAVDLAKRVFGTTAALFTEEEINRSLKNGPWVLAYMEGSCVDFGV